MEKYFSQPTMDLLAAMALGDQGGTAAALKAGANINEVGLTGTTPLIYSVIKLDKRTVNALLALGADANPRQQDGHTALSAAYELVSVDPTMLETLIDSGKCRSERTDADGDPLLYFLIGSGRLDFIAMALKKGANPSALSGAECPLVVEAVIIERYDESSCFLMPEHPPDSTDGAGRPLLWWVNKGASQVMSPAGKINQARLRLKARIEHPLHNEELFPCVPPFNPVLAIPIPLVKKIRRRKTVLPGLPKWRYAPTRRATYPQKRPWSRDWINMTVIRKQRDAPAPARLYMTSMEKEL